MKINKKKSRLNRGAVLIAPILLLGILFLGGCGSDPVAPHEDPPALTEREAANQAGVIAMAMSEVGPQIIEFAGKSDKDSYTHTFPGGGDIAGTVYMSFFLGGAGGTSVPWGEADYGTLATGADEALVVSLGVGGTVALTFDINAALNRDTDTSTVNGGGTFASGPYSASFSFADLVVVSGDDYPSGGSMTFTGSGFTMTIDFTGASTAIVLINGMAAYIIDLDTGEVTEYVDT